MPIESFSLSHTQRGSFIIPISIKAELTEGSLFPLTSKTLIILKDYLETLNRLVNLNIDSPEKYAKEVVDNNIDSKIVRDFYSSDSIASIKEKYVSRISELTIYGKYNPILDTDLYRSNRDIEHINLAEIKPLNYSYIEGIERLEESLDDR